VHYKVGQLEIRSENAAKPASQASSALVDWIRRMDSVSAALDYGCGKLRYSGYLAAKCRRLTLVDCKIQVDRTQKIGGKDTTVRNYARKRWPHCRVLSVEEFEGEQAKVDFILCANVLSTIPLENVRSQVLTKLSQSLTKQGRCLFVAQYQNSYFKKIATSKRAVRHLDGWILKTPKGNFYYGILRREILSALATAHGFQIIEAWIDGQSAYVLAGRANVQPER